MTLEDEARTVNALVWRKLADRQGRELLGASLLLGSLEARSRDFR